MYKQSYWSLLVSRARALLNEKTLQKYSHIAHSPKKCAKNKQIISLATYFAAFTTQKAIISPLISSQTTILFLKKEVSALKKEVSPKEAIPLYK